MDNNEVCAFCGENTGFELYDGFYYCQVCNVQVENVMETCLDTPIHLYAGFTRHRINAPHPTIKEDSTPFIYQSSKGKPFKPNNFDVINSSHLSADQLSSELRMRYVMGVQRIMQSQCKVLMKRFGANSLISGLAGVIWFRFVAATRVFDKEWMENTFEASELQTDGDSEKVISEYKNSKGIVNIRGKSGVAIWFRDLKKKIPISYSLAVSFLACHMGREAIVAADICEWAAEGHLPYLNAFEEIEKCFGVGPSAECQLRPSVMFRPSRVVGSMDLEYEAGVIAQMVGLQLPPVNVFAIARRYLNTLSLPLEKILPQVVRLYEWSMPRDLWLSSGNQKRLPTCVCVMSLIVVTIRIMGNVNGFGIWEARKEKRGHVEESDIDYAKLVGNLEAAYRRSDTPEYSKDLPTYINYCKNVVFAGINTRIEEGRIIEKLHEFYELPEDTGGDRKDADAVEEEEEEEEEDSERGLKRLKLDMEENGFCYIPPRARPKRFDYLHYIRKNEDGGRVHVAHADYYILLRAAARVAKVALHDMHDAVLYLEKRLSWIENQIHHP